MNNLQKQESAPEVEELEVILDDNTATYIALPAVASGSEKEWTDGDEALLATCEKRIEHGIETTIDVANALYTIKAQALYRKHYKTFAEYCRLRWEFGRQHGYRLIQAAKIREELSPLGDTPLPETESQARPLTKLKTSAERAVAMKTAGKKAGGKPKTSHITQAVEDILATKGANEKLGKAAKPTRPKNTADLNEAVSVTDTLGWLDEAKALLDEEEIDSDRLLELLTDIETSVREIAAFLLTEKGATRE
jgi:hypothetical protein